MTRLAFAIAISFVLQWHGVSVSGAVFARARCHVRKKNGTVYTVLLNFHRGDSTYICDGRQEQALLVPETTPVT